jgi:hypothetical protein
MSKDLPQKVVAKIVSKEHETIEDAIDSVVKHHEKITEDYYFMVFDMNNDFEGGEFEKIFKKRISYNNPLQLQGEVGKCIEDAQLTDSHMVMFMNSRRAKSFLEKVQEWEKEYGS